MASELDIWNNALTKLGATRITSTSEQSVNARACASVYPTIRDKVLRSHPWNCATQRFKIAANAVAPLFGYTNAFPLPTGWLKVLPPDPKENMFDRDWIIEAGQILSDQSPPLNVRCVMRITDVNQMDISLQNAIAADMAHELCEQLTQSNTKKADAKDDYKTAIAEAKKSNAIEKVPMQSVEDEWIVKRN